MDEWLILGLFSAYLLIFIIIGFWSSRKIRSRDSFFVADRTLGPLLLSTTLTATVVGGSATIAAGALVYQVGLPALWLDIGSACGLIALGFFLAGIVRRTKRYTLPEIIGTFFGERVRSVSALLVLISQIAWIALLIQGAGAILLVLFPLNYELLLIVISVIFIGYTFLGGQLAVVYTDFVQFIVMIVGVCGIAAPLIFLEAWSGFDQLSVLYTSFPVNASVGSLSAASFFLLMFLPNLVGPDVYSKVLSARDEHAAKKGVLLSGVFRVIFAVAIGILGLSAAVLFPGLQGAEISLAIPKVILILPPLLAALILAAFLLVMLSSADSVLISSGTILSVDITKKRSITMSRIGVIVVGGIALGIALYLQDIIQTLILAYTVFAAGLTLPVLFGFFKNTTKVSSQGAFFSLIGGGSSALIWLLLGNPLGIDAVLLGLLFSLIPLVVMRGRLLKTLQKWGED